MRNLARTGLCLDCDEPAEWARHTQFSGTHPFCIKHAEAQKDFQEMLLGIKHDQFWARVENKDE